MRPILHCFLWEPIITGMTPGCQNSDFYISIDTAFRVHLFYLLSKKKVNVSIFKSIKCTSDKIFLTFGTKTLQNGIFLKIGGVCPRFLVSHCNNDISTCFSAF